MTVSTILEAFGTVAAFTITNANLASSATAGWASNAIDNSTNLFLDAIVMVDLAAVNTAPANSKAIFLYAFASVDGGTIYTGTGDGTASGAEATLTFPDVSTLPIVAPLLGVIPYPVQNKAIRATFSVARCFGGILPPKWAIGMVNHSGMTLNVTSIKYIELKNTVG